MPIDNSQERYIGFITDYAFKRFFGTEANKELLIDFLNSLLVGKEVITDLQYKNTERLPEVPIERKGVFDVCCTNKKGEHIIVEIYNARQHHVKELSLYYSTFPIQLQDLRRDWVYNLDKLYSVNILNFNLDEKNPTRYRRDILLTDLETNQVDYNGLCYIYLELTKFNLKLSELKTQLERWLYAMKNMSSFQNQPKELSGKIFDRLFESAEFAKFTPQEVLEYQQSLKSI